MKKTYIALAVLSLTALISCENRELSFNQYSPEDGEIVFHISRGSAATKSSENVAPVRGMTFDLGSGVFLEETITDLNNLSYGPATKGTPGYTENFHALYDGFNATVFRKGETSAYDSEARFEIVDEESLLYKHRYDNDLWAKEGLYFFLNAYYKNGSMAGVSSLTPHMKDEAAVTTGDNQHPEYKVGDISFNFDNSTLSTATSQSDLLFTSRPVSEAEYKKLISKDQGIDVLFHHALTGVKFRVGNDNTGTTKTVITKVEISGLYDKGLCVITPDPETDYTDVQNNYSSSTAVKWYNYGTTEGTFFQEFNNPTYVVDQDNPENNKKNPDGTVGEDDYENGSYTFGPSWYSAASGNNLNDADGSQTFWFIPQSFKNADNSVRNVTLKVTFRVKTPDTPNGTEITHTIKDFGAKLADADVEWKAGELRTYTLNPLDVDVEIFDTMSGLEKSGLHVTNTGNVKEYVRMIVIGNWYGWLSEESQENGEEPSILVGYTTETGNEMVKAWYNGDDTFGTGFDPSFTKGKPAAGSKWVEGTGGYYYYTDIIGPGDRLSSTTSLFQSYKLNETWIPEIWIPSSEGGRIEAVGVHLIMECAIQAISALDSDGNEYKNCWTAWTTATGKTIAAKE